MITKLNTTINTTIFNNITLSDAINKDPLLVMKLIKDNNIKVSDQIKHFVESQCEIEGGLDDVNFFGDVF